MTGMTASSRLRAWSAVVALALAALLAGARPAAAQDITATLTGMVTDHKGGALPGVTVSVKNGVTGLHKDVVTNAQGVYTASFLDAGRYEVSFALEGFRTRTVRKVQLRARERRQLDVVLKPGGAKDAPSKIGTSPPASGASGASASAPSPGA
jgi:hypothetical protein